MKTAVAKAGIRRNGMLVHLTPQSLRRAHATRQAMRGVNESVLQGLLGHAAGSRMTQWYYVQVTTEAKHAAVITLPVRERTTNRDVRNLATSGKTREQRASEPTPASAQCHRHHHENLGAGEGIRTLDPNLGKVVLYP